MHKAFQILRAIEADFSNQTCQLPELINEINYLILKIHFSINRQQADVYFEVLEKIQYALYRIRYKLGIIFPLSINQFLKDFDNLHDIRQRDTLFEKNKEQILFCDQRYMPILLRYQNEIEDTCPTGDIQAQTKFLYNQLIRLVNVIQSSKDFNDANQYFNDLEILHHCLAIMTFKCNISLDKALSNFVKVFDRIDDINERKVLYEKLKTLSIFER